MSDAKNLIGKAVSLCLDGGWEISGVIDIADDVKLVLTTQDGPVIVYRAKISLIIMRPEDILNQNVKPQMIKKKEEKVTENVAKDEPELLFEENGVGFDNHYGSFLPNDLLTPLEEQIDGSKYPVDFTIQQSNLRRVEKTVLADLVDKNDSSK